MDIETLEDTRVEETEWFHAYLAIATTTGAKVLHTCDRITISDNEGEQFKHYQGVVVFGDGHWNLSLQ